MHSIVPPLVRDLSDWNPETRLKSVQVLHSLILHSENKATIQLSTLIDGIVSAAKDEEKKIGDIVSNSYYLLKQYICIILIF